MYVSRFSIHEALAVNHQGGLAVMEFLPYSLVLCEWVWNSCYTGVCYESGDWNSHFTDLWGLEFSLYRLVGVGIISLQTCGGRNSLFTDLWG